MWLVFSAERRKPEGPERASRSSSVHYRKVSLEERVSQGHRADKHQVTWDPLASHYTRCLCCVLLWDLPSVYRHPATRGRMLLGSPVLCNCTPQPQAGAPLLRLDLPGSRISAPVAWQTDKNLASPEDCAPGLQSCLRGSSAWQQHHSQPHPPEGGGLCWPHLEPQLGSWQHRFSFPSSLFLTSFLRSPFYFWSPVKTRLFS